MKLSIITPIFGNIEHLELTIKSVLGQSFSNLEYIIIGQKDLSEKTQSVLKKYSDQIEYWASEKEDNFSVALNTGLQKATGDIVAWLCPGDTYYPGIFGKITAAFEANSELVFLYGNAALIKRDGDFLRYFSEVQPFDLLVLRNYINLTRQPTVFLKRDALEAVGFLDKSLSYEMHWNLWCQLACQHPKGVKYFNGLVATSRECEDREVLNSYEERLAEIRIVNRRYKTTTLNMAVLLYRRLNFNHQAKWPVMMNDRLVSILISLLMAIAGISRKYRHRRLFGFIPQSSYIEKSAIIKLPLWGKTDNKVRLLLQNPFRKIQSVKISVNGRLLHASLFNLKEKKEVLLDLGHVENDLLEIAIECGHDFSKKKGALKLLNITLFDEKKL